MNSLFARNLKIVTAVHLALLAVLFLSPFVVSLFKKPLDLSIPVEFMVEVPLAPSEGKDSTKKAVTEPKKEPDDGLIPAPRPKPKPKPKPEPKKDDAEKAKEPSNPKIDPSKIKITRTSGGPPTGKLLSEAEIRKLLEMGATPGDHTSIPGEEARCFDIVRKTLYAAWVQPSAEEAGSAVAEVSIRLEKDGRISGWSLSKSSGNAALDASVMQISKTVQRIDYLTWTFLREHSTVTVAFKVEAGYGGGE